MIMKNHHTTNNTKPISQNFGNNLKSEVGNNNGPKVLDKNIILNLRNERNNIRIHPKEYPTLNKKLLNPNTKIYRYNIQTTMIKRS